MYALAVAAGGPAGEVEDSRTRLAKLEANLSPAEKSAVAEDIARASAELIQDRTVKLDPITGKSLSGESISAKSVSARFNLVFDSSPRPERADFVDGDESLRSASAQLLKKDFPIRFPDVSSVKIVRQGRLSCGSSGCSIELLPIEK